MDVEARARGDNGVRLSRVAALCRHRRADRPQESYWFAFRRPDDWVWMDPDRSNGSMHLDSPDGRVDVLVVDRRAAVRAAGGPVPYRRPWAMVTDGFRTWSTDPDRVERIDFNGRPADAVLWDRPSGAITVTYDLATGLCVAITDSEESLELDHLRVNSEVADTWFDVPPALGSWHGGTAYVVEDAESPGTYVTTWKPESGPSGIEVEGPGAASLDEAISWARSRATSVFLHDAQGHRRSV